MEIPQHAAGTRRNCTDAILRDHGQDLGVRSTYDLNTLLDTLLE
jgi:hypothetical protein